MLAVTIDWATVGDPGNVADDTGYGAVGYEYRIGKYEVTIAQYTEFLNAVARSDPYGLFNPLMSSNLNIAGISRSGTSGSYVYGIVGPAGVTPSGANSLGQRPVTYVSWFDAARFANWLQNGQGSGSTENGAYTLNGATTGVAPARNAGAQFTIPTENEWYKAAYYKGGGSNVGYWDYATRSDQPPGNTVGLAANHANYNNNSGLFAVTQSSVRSGSQNYLTDVGAFAGSASAYGTFDQTGNVLEWNDLTGLADSSRGRRGGSWLDSGATYQTSSGRSTFGPYDETDMIGFRLAGPAVVPVNRPPTSIALSNATIQENQASGTVVGVLSTVDPDASDAFTYELVTGSGSHDNVSFAIVGNELRTATRFNHEAKHAYSVRVRSTDRAGVATEKSFQVGVSDAVEGAPPTTTPTGLPLRPSPAGSWLHSSATGASASTAWFPTTLRDVQGLTVHGYVTYSQHATVSNWFTPAGSPQTFYVYETYVRSDVDQVISVSSGGDDGHAIFVDDVLLAGGGFGVDVEGNLVLTAGAPRKVILVGCNAGGPTHVNFGPTADRSLAIEQVPGITTSALPFPLPNAAPTSIGISNARVAENAPAGTVVGTLTATDPDANEIFTFTLVTGEGSADNSSFVVVGSQVRTAASFDFETKSAYTLRVRATDRSGLSIERSFTVIVSDVSEPSVFRYGFKHVNEPIADAHLIESVGMRKYSEWQNPPITYWGPTANNAEGRLVYRFDFPQVARSARMQIHLPSWDYTRPPESSYIGAGRGAWALEVSRDGQSWVTIRNNLEPRNWGEKWSMNDLLPTEAMGTRALYVRMRFMVEGAPNSSYTDAQFGRSTAAATTNVFEIEANLDGGSPPTDILLTGSSIAEGALVGTVVGELSSIDADGSTGHVYALVAGPGDTGNARFSIVGNQLRTAVVLDHESASTHAIRVRSTDASGLMVEKTFSISVMDATPEPPKAILLSATAVAENQPPHTVVGVLESLDDDAGDTFTYSIVAGAEDNVAFEIVDGQLRTAVPLDRESGHLRRVKVRSTDSTGLSREQTLQVTVVNVNEQPTAVMLVPGRIGEGALPGTVVGSLWTTDQDMEDAFTYSLVGGTGADHNAAFLIVGNQVRVATTPRLQDGATRTIRVRSTDAGGLWAESVLTIAVDDRNDAPTDVLLESNQIAENKPAGTVVGTLAAVDPDGGGSYGFTLVTGEGATDNGLFRIVGNALISRKAFDYETKNTYSIRVRVTDQGGLWTEKALNIVVTDVDESPLGIDLSVTAVVENSVVGAWVGRFQALDADGSGSYSFALVPGEGDTDNGLFMIEGFELRTAAVFDYEARASLTIRVRVTDAAGAVEKVFAIGINDVNEAPVDIGVIGGEIPENERPGTVAARLAALDADTAADFVYSLVAGLGDSDNRLFRILGDRMLAATTFDFEQRRTYSIRVQATDAFGLATEKVITIRVLDVNEAPTLIALSRALVNENLPVGTTVGTFTAADPDANNTISYRFASGSGGGGNRFFQVVGNELRTAATFDREAKGTYNVRIQAVDQGGARGFAVFTIVIGDVNEAPTVVTMVGGQIAENAASGTLAATLGTTDQDRSDTFTYALVAGSGDVGNALFEIRGNQVVVVGSLDYEMARTVTVRVRSTDRAGLFVESPFTFAITDVNEAPLAMTFVQRAFAASVGPATIVGRLSATDSDSRETLRYALVSDGPSDNALFTISRDTVRTRSQVAFEPGRTYTIRVRVTDKGGLWREQAFQITSLASTVAGGIG